MRRTLRETLARREVLFGAAALAACGPRAKEGGKTRGDVFAAGQPAAILTMVLAPARLLGWPRRPSRDALTLLPAFANLPEYGALTSGGAPANLEKIASLEPGLILDYGDTEADYSELAQRIRARVGVPYRLIDGALARTPSALIEAGTLLDADARAARLAERATDILSRWTAEAGAGPSFYYARGRDGLETGFAGALATQVLEGAGWRNVATGGGDIGRVSREQVAAWAPDVLVTLDAGFARAALADPFWSRGSAVPRRILLLPELPFGWIDRPPSVNRLLGCAWFAGGPMPSVDASTIAMARRFSRDFYGTTPSAASAATLIPRWLA